MKTVLNRGQVLVRNPEASFPIYTIGHGLQPYEQLLDRLIEHCIEVVVDVRASSASHGAPQFERTRLRLALDEVGIIYLDFSESLGGKPDGHVAEQGFDFKRGIKTLVSSLDLNYRVALLGKYEEPKKCRRRLPVALALVQAGVDVQHIMPDGSLLSEAACSQ